jgi:Fuc2NAc and GlcNAc transferase
MRVAVNRGILDAPNARSSHNRAIPRGGGVSFVVTFSVILIVLFTIGFIQSDIFIALLLGGTLVAGVGFWDDHGHVPARWRLLIHVIAVTAALFAIGERPALPLFDEDSHIGLYGYIPATLLLVWVLNLFNFMDGIDGLASVEAIFVAFGAALLIYFSYADNISFLEPSSTVGYISVLLLVFALSVCGFLVWNWPPARLFMGDVGSGYLGFILGVFLIYTPIETNLTIWSWLILLGVFIVDATVTLIRRIITGQSWYEAHRSHAYQHAARKFSSHRVVTVSVLFLNIVWLLPLAWLAAIKPGLGAIFAIVAYIPLILLALYFRAGKV